MISFQRNIFKLRRADIIPPVGDCFAMNIYISPIDAEDADDGTVILTYTACGGTITEIPFPDAGNYTNVACADVGSGFAFHYIKGGASFNAGNSGFTGFGDACTI